MALTHLPPTRTKNSFLLRCSARVDSAFDKDDPVSDLSLRMLLSVVPSTKVVPLLSPHLTSRTILRIASFGNVGAEVGTPVLAGLGSGGGVIGDSGGGGMPVEATVEATVEAAGLDTVGDEIRSGAATFVELGRPYLSALWIY